MCSYKFENLYDLSLRNILRDILYENLYIFELHFSSFFPFHNYRNHQTRINLTTTRLENEKGSKIFQVNKLLYNRIHLLFLEPK